MFIFKLMLLSKLDDIKNMTGKGIKKGFIFLFEGIKELLLTALITIHQILIVIFSIAVKITNLGFVAGLILMIVNGIEAYTNSLFFTDTKYFNIMIFLILLHFGVHFIYYLLVYKERD